MNNVEGTQGVPLTIFGGCVSELAPEDLPEGASPLLQDVDFNPGSVFTRGGRVNQYTYANLSIDKITQYSRNVPGVYAPNEVAWITPQDAQNNVPGQYANVALNQGVNISDIVQFRQLAFNTATTTFIASFLSPVTAGNFVFIAFFIVDPNGSVEGVNMPSIVDNAGQDATHINQMTNGPLYNQNSFAITQSKAIGGNQNYTFHLQTNAAGTLTASTYAVCMVEVTGTNNSSADPIDQLVAAPNNSGISFSTTATVNTVQSNELFLAVCQSVDTANYSPFMNPGPYFHTVTTKTNIQRVGEFLANAPPGAAFQEQFFGGEILVSNPSAALTVCDVGNMTGFNAMVIWVTLKMTNTLGVGNLGLAPLGFDSAGATGGGGNGSNTFTLPTLATSLANEAIYYLVVSKNPGIPGLPYPLGAVNALVNGQAALMGTFVANPGTFVPPTLSFSVTSPYAVAAFSIPVVGNSVPWPLQDTNEYGLIPAGGNTQNFNGGTLTAGNSILCVVMGAGNATSLAGTISFTNTVGDVFQSLGSSSVQDIGGNYVDALWFLAQNIVGGNTDISLHYSGGSNQGGNWAAFEFKGGRFPVAPSPHSQVLTASNFGFLIPSNQPVLGMQIEISGHQSTLDPTATITVSTNQPGSQSITTQLPLADGTLTLGPALGNFGLTLTPALLNNQAFAVTVVANESSTVVPASMFIYAIRVRVFVAPVPPANYNWIKTYEQSDGEIDTLALDSNGILWDEDVDTNPTVFNSIFTTILQNTFAKGVTFADIEYIAFSNLLNGTDVPRQWNGTNLDRISMVGPGDKCSASSAGTGTSGSGQVPIQQITQAPKVQIRRIAWGTNQSPLVSTPGNLLVVFGEGRNNPANPTQVDFSTLAPYTPSFGTNTNVVISGVPVPFPRKNGGSLPYNINGTYQVGNVSLQNVGGNESAPTFTLPSPTTIWAYSDDFTTNPWPPNNTPTSNWFYQSCIATITMAQPLPNVGPGSTIQISGTGSAYDGTWTVLQAPNSSQMNITEAHVTANVAIYTFQLVSGSMPQVGQLVTVQNVLNSGAGDPQIFNTTQTIAAINDNQFSFAVSNPDTGQNLQAPPGLAYVSGTTFTFDAGQIVNSGNAVPGGYVVQQGLLGTGIRKCCYSFLTRSGYITQPSPIFTFNITGGAGAITVSNLSTGPPNVVARIVFFTGANGANFFYIPQTQIITVGGVTQTNTSTIVPDNSSTTAQFNFSDAVLLSATAVDITGNNLFNTIELGSCRGLLTYSSRMFAWGEQLKVTNFRNLSFDGGFSGQPGAAAPLGWTVAGAGGLLLQSSPVFGWSYQIQNSSGSSQASWGMLTQNAYQDEFGVAIIASATLYSVRITALATTPIASGNLIVDLYSPNAGGALGTFSLPLSSLTSTMQIYTGTILTSALRTVPNDLLLRIWAQNIPGTPTSTIQIDRIEPFQTLVPVNSTALKASYVNNQEAFDLLTGVCGPAQNMQPINGAMELFDLLYALKERSWFSTFDNGVTEPNRWNWKTVSNKTGTIGINSYDYGEGWCLSADRQGVHFFEGGEPLKISQEIQPVWDSINWQYGYTIWLRNDPEQKRFTVGIPIATPNQWMPEFPANPNPTSPNVILMCNYRELNSGVQMAQTGPIRSTYMGRLMSPEPARKWSFWNIRCPYSDFIDRNNNQWPQFYCTGYSDQKIFALQAATLSDDGAAINSFWVSYGFVKPEMADAKGLGLFRMEFPYLTVLATGTGTANVFVYPESPFNNPPYDLDPLPLPNLSQGDLELGVNVKGNRFFIRIGTNQVGSAFRLSKLVVPLIQDTWSPVRGWNSVTA